MEYLLVGTIIDSFSLDGTIKIVSSTDRPEQRFKEGAKLFLFNKLTKEYSEITVEKSRLSGDLLFVKFEEYNTPEEVKAIKGFEIHTIKDRKDLEVGYYYFSDLVGCKVIDESKNLLGIVSKVEEFPAQLTLRVKRDNGPDFFVPFVKAFIKDVNIENKEIMINVIGGML